MAALLEILLIGHTETAGKSMSEFGWFTLSNDVTVGLAVNPSNAYKKI